MAAVGASGALACRSHHGGDGLEPGGLSLRSTPFAGAHLDAQIDAEHCMCCPLSMVRRVGEELGM